MYNDEKITDIRKLKCTNPKKFWKVINTNNKKDEVQATLEDLYNFFKTCNEKVSNAEGDSDNIEFTKNETNDEINHPISKNEILQAIQSLKTNKAPGLDDIVNEQIKALIPYMVPIFVKLFNIILIQE